MLHLRFADRVERTEALIWGTLVLAERPELTAEQMVEIGKRRNLIPDCSDREFFKLFDLSNVLNNLVEKGRLVRLGDAGQYRPSTEPRLSESDVEWLKEVERRGASEPPRMTDDEQRDLGTTPSEDPAVIPAVLADAPVTEAIVSVFGVDPPLNVDAPPGVIIDDAPPAAETTAEPMLDLNDVVPTAPETTPVDSVHVKPTVSPPKSGKPSKK